MDLVDERLELARNAATFGSGASNRSVALAGALQDAESMKAALDLFRGLGVQ